MSDLKTYLPAFSETFHVAVPLNATPVALEIPGPVRWKLSVAERSVTTIVNAPTGRLESAEPSVERSEIFAPGPTDASSFVAAGFGVGVGVGVGESS